MAVSYTLTNAAIGNTFSVGGAATTTVAKSIADSSASIGEGLKKFWYFYNTEGASALGTKLRDARKAGQSFKLGKAMNDCYAAHVAAKEAAKGAAKSGILKGLLKNAGKLIGPALIILPELYNAYKELQAGGGIGGAAKSLAKGAIGLGGFSLGSFVASALGLVGGPIGFVAGIGLGMAGSWLAGKVADMILGPTQTELAAKRETIAKAEAQTPEGQKAAINLQRIDRQIDNAEQWLKGFDLNSNSCVGHDNLYSNANQYGNGQKRVFVA